MRTGVPSVAYSSVARFTVLNYSNNIMTHLRKDYKPMKNKIKQFLKQLIWWLFLPLIVIIAFVYVGFEEREYYE